MLIDHHIAMKMVNVSDMKSNFSRYLKAAQEGEKVTICLRNKPVARFEIIEDAARPANRTQLGNMAGSTTVHDDLTEPTIPTEDWDMLQE